MKIENILKTTSYFNYVDKINSLSNELLYGENGYYFLKSFEAIKNKDNFVQKFKYEANKVKNELNYSDDTNYIDYKCKEFILSLEKHYFNQLYVWVDEVFQGICENYFFNLSLNKSLAKEIYEILSRILNWYCNVKKLDKIQISNITNELNLKFNKALKSQDGDYLNCLEQIKTDENIFIEIWNLISSNLDEFLKFDFSMHENKLSSYDINFLSSLTQKLASAKKEVVLDEVDLINYMLNEYKINTVSEKYKIIQSVYRDFAFKQQEVKILSEEDKIKIIKRRLEIAFDRKNKTCNYFKKIISSS